MMKLNKNFVIPMTVGVIMCVIMIIFSKMPISITLAPIIVLATTLIVQKKSHNNFRLMWFIGVISGIFSIGILIVLALLAEEYTWAEIIFTFPY